MLKGRSFSPGFAAVALTVGGLPTTAVAAPDRWDPGHATTSRVEGEVKARDEPSRTDGVYGRFEGDFDVGLGLGAELIDGDLTGAARFSLHYFSMAGVYAGYADSFGRRTPVARLTTVGIDLRPAFVPRWALDFQQGPAVLDLALDSISIGMGAYWTEQDAQSFGSERGFEGSLGMALPILGTADGPWLEGRAILRWADPRDARRDGPESSGLLLLTWHTLLESGFAKTAGAPDHGRL